jgi:hypothetical protein
MLYIWIQVTQDGKENKQIMKTNLEIIKEWYETLNPEIVAPNVDWKLADGFPADGHYHGRKAVFEEWLPKLLAQFDEWKATPEQLLDAGDAIVSLGYYSGRSKATGREFEVPFAHIWFMKDGQITKVSHHTNTLMLHQAITDSREQRARSGVSGSTAHNSSGSL